MVGIAYKRRLLQTHAVSEVIGIILVFSISSTVISGILLWSGDRLEQEKMTSSSTVAMNQIMMLDDTFQELIHQGANSSRIVNFAAGKGTVSVGSDPSSGTRLVVFYSVNRSFYFNVSNFNDTDEKSFDITILSYNGSAPYININYLNNKYPFQAITQSPALTNTSGTKTITANKPLVDAVRIDIYDYKWGCVGRIWLFDLGYLRYEIPSSSSFNPVIIENGAIVSLYPSNPQFYNLEKPHDIYYTNISDDHVFVMPILQIRRQVEIIGPEESTYKITLKLNKTNVGEQSFYINPFSHWKRIYNTNGVFLRWDFKAITPNRFNYRIQIYGDHADVWLRYLNTTYNTVFSKYPDGSFFCKQPHTSFALVYSVFDIKVEVI